MPSPSTLNGVVWGAFYETAVARRLPRLAFDPPPAVDAGMLVLRRRARPLVPADRAVAYRRFVAAGFRHGPRAVATASEVTRLAGPGASARDLDQHQWAELYRRRLSRPRTPGSRAP